MTSLWEQLIEVYISIDSRLIRHGLYTNLVQEINNEFYNASTTHRNMDAP